MPREGIMIDYDLLVSIRQDRGYDRRDVVQRMAELDEPVEFARFSLYQVETGRRNPSPRVLEALVTVLRAPKSKLVKEKNARRAVRLRKEDPED